jgi:hypothetical protein
MRLPALAPHSLPTPGFGSLHEIIFRFGVGEVLRGFLHRGPRTRASTYGTCTRGGGGAAAAASSFGHRRRWARARPCAGGGSGTGVGGGGRGHGVARKHPPRHSTFWDSARLTATGIQVVDKVRDGCSTPRLLLLSVRSFMTHGGRRNSSKFMGCLKVAIHPACTASFISGYLTGSSG